MNIIEKLKSNLARLKVDIPSHFYKSSGVRDADKEEILSHVPALLMIAEGVEKMASEELLYNKYRECLWCLKDRYHEPHDQNCPVPLIEKGLKGLKEAGE